MIRPVKIQINGKEERLWPDDVARIKREDKPKYVEIKKKLHEKGLKLTCHGRDTRFHFAHINGGGGINGGDNESPAHELVKEAIARAEVLELMYFDGIEKKTVYLYNDMEKTREEIEKIRYSDTGRKFKPDVIIVLQKTDPPELFDELKGRVAIEVNHTHQVEDATIIAYQETDIACFEFDINSLARYITEFSDREVEKYARKFSVRPGEKNLYMWCKVINLPSKGNDKEG